MKEVKINTEFITLGQLIKFVGVISQGGEVKYFLSTNKILVNGEEDNRRGRKLYNNDVVEVVNKTKYVIRHEN